MPFLLSLLVVGGLREYTLPAGARTAQPFLSGVRVLQAQMLCEHPNPGTEQDCIAPRTIQVQIKPQLDHTRSGDLQRNTAGDTSGDQRE